LNQSEIRFSVENEKCFIETLISQPQIQKMFQFNLEMNQKAQLKNIMESKKLPAEIMESEREYSVPDR
jgi:hypothetical protein